METRKYTQFGTFCVALFVPLLCIFAIRLYRIGISFDAESIGFLVLLLVMLACLLTFYKLSIYIDKTSISFKFGVGWFGKSYRFSEIDFCTPVKNHFLHGIGIRWMGNGWLYNVSGLKAIEIRFKNKNTIVRIGTDKPMEVCEAVKVFSIQ